MIMVIGHYLKVRCIDFLWKNNRSMSILNYDAREGRSSIQSYVTIVWIPNRTKSDRIKFEQMSEHEQPLYVVTQKDELNDS